MKRESPSSRDRSRLFFTASTDAYFARLPASSSSRSAALREDSGCLPFLLQAIFGLPRGRRMREALRSCREVMRRHARRMHSWSVKIPASGRYGHNSGRSLRAVRMMARASSRSAPLKGRRGARTRAVPMPTSSCTAGFVARRRDGSSPRTVRWHLTPRGWDTLPILIRLIEHASKWEPESLFADKAPRTLRDIFRPEIAEKYAGR